VRTFLVFLLIVLALIGAIAIYLVVTTPKESAGIRFPLTPSQRALVASIPATAESFALIPNAAALEGKVSANPVTREAMDEYRERVTLPSPWMLGGADVIAWRTGKATTYFIRLDFARSLLARIYLMIAGDAGSTRVLINASDEEPIAPAEVDSLLALGSSLPAGEALVVQREQSRGAFPPIGRPAVSTISISPSTIDIASVSPANMPANQPAPAIPRENQATPAGLPALHKYPRNAILTATFTSPPRLIDEMNRLIGAKASVLLRDGGAIALYSVDTNKLLPRPREVLILPATPERRAILHQFTDQFTGQFAQEAVPHSLGQAIGFHIETAEVNGELLVAFDDDSIAKYKSDTLDTPSLAGNSWSLHLDPQRALPMLEGVSDAPGLRFLAPRLYRSARDLGSWIEHLKGARSIEAAASTSATGEQLRVRIAAK
jgi:hypothetical protein